MKLTWLAPDGEWQDALTRALPPTAKRVPNVGELIRSTDADMYIIHSRSIGFDRFCDWAEASVTDIRVGVIVSGTEQDVRKWMRYGLSKGFEMWEEKDDRSIRSLAHEIGLQFKHVTSKTGSKSNRLVMFTGSTPNIGTTVAAFGTAIGIARRTNKQVGYLCLNLKSPKIHHYLGIDEPVTTLDGLRSDLKTASLTPQRLRQYCRTPGRTPNLHMLFGNMFREQAEFYTPDDIRHLLHVASASFDCCIVDVNAYWDNAATVCAAMQAEMKIVVTRNRLSSFQEDCRRNLQTCAALFDLSPQSFDLLIAADAYPSSFRPKDIRKETGMNVMGCMRSYEELNSYLDRGKIESFFYTDTRAEKDLAGLVRAIVTLFRLEARMQKSPKTVRFSPARLFNG